MAKSGRWTEDEIERVRERWGLRSEASIARELGRSTESVRRKAASLFRGATRKGPWAEDELNRLRQHIGATPSEVVARVLGRRVEDVESKIESLARERRSGRWSREELQLLRRLYGTRTDEDLAVALGRTVASIRRVAKRYALSKDKAFVKRLRGDSATRMPRWTEEELDLLRDLYATESNLEIAHQVGRSIKSVVSKAHQLGLKKDIERLREMGRENVSTRYSGRGN